MNSKLINWWFNDEFKNPTISGYELHQIPIKRNEKIEIIIVELVSEILENINSENLVLKNKNEIDELVYELYQLSKEEIEIVENN